MNQEYFEEYEFLGQTHVLPADAYQYMEIIKELTDYYAEFLKVHNNRIQEIIDKEKQGGNKGFWLQVQLEDEQEDVKKQVFTDLKLFAVIPMFNHFIGDDNEFGLTEADIFERTKGYKYLNRDFSKIKQAMQKLVYERDRNVDIGQQRVYREAESSITGMGFSVYTNSLSSGLLYLAMQKNAMMKQAKQAEKRYQNEAGQIAKNEYSYFAKAANSLFYNECIPFIRHCLDMWFDEVVDIVITVEQKKWYPQFSIIRKYDINESNKIINDKIGFSNTEERLRAAFLKCPFNQDIYLEIIKNDMMDEDTLDTALYFCDENLIQEALIEECKKNIGNLSKIRNTIDYLEGWMERNLRDFDREETISEIFSEITTEVYKKYSVLRNLCSNKSTLGKWIFKKIAKSSDELLTKSNPEIRAIIRNSVESIISKQILEIINEYEIIAYNKIAFSNDEKTIPEINERYISEIEFRINNYREEIVTRKKEYEIEQTIYVQEINKQRIAIEETKKEIDGLGLSGIIKKGKLKKELLQMEQQLDEYIRTKDPTKLKVLYTDMVRE